MKYYHTAIEGWISADRKYTRNILVPYLFEFGYAAQRQLESFTKLVAEAEALHLKVNEYIKSK